MKNTDTQIKQDIALHLRSVAAEVRSGDFKAANLMFGKALQGARQLGDDDDLVMELSYLHSKLILRSDRAALNADSLVRDVESSI